MFKVPIFITITAVLINNCIVLYNINFFLFFFRDILCFFLHFLDFRLNISYGQKLFFSCNYVATRILNLRFSCMIHTMPYLPFYLPSNLSLSLSHRSLLDIQIFFASTHSRQWRCKPCGFPSLHISECALDIPHYEEK